ncbi:hypothetical protein FRX31_024638 [Thalictrum thalictroides]|uniref:Uncharacterized protein n=1 Tax=Thalictrum thalictroides TaxID=46969 RepID=A0A7J6VNL2_THATH|nr:hypothetical protein FRX31_024638 [Thalictrum thalictroides]
MELNLCKPLRLVIRSKATKSIEAYKEVTNIVFIIVKIATKLADKKVQKKVEVILWNKSRNISNYLAVQLIGSLLTGAFTKTGIGHKRNKFQDGRKGEICVHVLLVLFEWLIE